MASLLAAALLVNVLTSAVTTLLSVQIDRADGAEALLGGAWFLLTYGLSLTWRGIVAVAVLLAIAFAFTNRQFLTANRPGYGSILAGLAAGLSLSLAGMAIGLLFTKYSLWEPVGHQSWLWRLFLPGDQAAATAYIKVEPGAFARHPQVSLAQLLSPLPAGAIAGAVYAWLTGRWRKAPSVKEVFS